MSWANSACVLHPLAAINSRIRSGVQYTCRFFLPICLHFTPFALCSPVRICIPGQEFPGTGSEINEM